MRIVYLKLVNFIGVKAATGLNEIELKYDRIKQPIIQLYGRNRCGKTVLIQQHHPFSSINLTGDERNDLSLIIPGETGVKTIAYEVNDKVYTITHTYRPSGKSHTVSSSIVHANEELNPSGGVTTANTLIEKLLGINKYSFQFIINGTNLSSFAGMGSTQRKTLLNKAMGIDIYDKINRLATDDHRVTSKLIASLNHTKEYLLSEYGTFDILFAKVEEMRAKKAKNDFLLNQMKSNMDALRGKVQVFKNQNPEGELATVQAKISEYERALESIGGTYDPDMPDKLVSEQISMNTQLSELKAQRSIYMNDLDNLYAKQHDIERVVNESKRARDDCMSMEQKITELTNAIDGIHVEQVGTFTSSQYLFSLRTLAQSINSTCQEITTSLSEDMLKMMTDLVDHDVDVASIIMQEGASLMDSEAEKSVITYVRAMMQSIDGEIPDPDQCNIQNRCLYRRVYDAFETYFKTYQSKSKGKFSRYDLEQFEHAHKNILTIRRLTATEIPDVMREIFEVKKILHRLCDGKSGCDVDYINYMIEETAKNEQRNQYIQQRAECEKQLEIMRSNVLVNVDENAVSEIQERIQDLQEKRNQCDEDINRITTELEQVDRKRLMISGIQRVDINALQNRRLQLTKSVNEMMGAQQTYTELYTEYQSLSTSAQQLDADLDRLEKAVDQYTKTTAEIDQQQSADERYKVIAEATSSTKGMPVIAIRDTVDRAISTANRLLQVMYDDEIQLLRPVINESQFTLPFRCGNNKSADIRYGSQSESTLLSLALSLSLASTMTHYSVPLVDEIDAYLDMAIRDGFILMLESMMSAMGMQQMFLISHNLQKGQFEHIVHTVDISEIITKGVT